MLPMLVDTTDVGSLYIVATNQYTRTESSTNQRHCQSHLLLSFAPHKQASKDSCSLAQFYNK